MRTSDAEPDARNFHNKTFAMSMQHIVGPSRCVRASFRMHPGRPCCVGEWRVFKWCGVDTMLRISNVIVFSKQQVCRCISAFLVIK